MWIVKRSDVGRLAYGRLVRDGVIAPLIPGVALPRDVADVPALRREVLSACVPPGCQVTAAAALWAHGRGPLPTEVHVRTPVGRHVRHWDGDLALIFHGVGVVAPGGAIADIETATADALRWQGSRLVDSNQYGRRLAPVRRRAS